MKTMKFLYSLENIASGFYLLIFQYFYLFLFYLYICTSVATNATLAKSISKKLKNIVWYSKMLKRDQRNSI